MISKVSPREDADGEEEAKLRLVIECGKPAPVSTHIAWARAAAVRRDWVAALERWALCEQRLAGRQSIPLLRGRIQALRGLGRHDAVEELLCQAIEGGVDQAGIWFAWASSPIRRGEHGLVLDRLGSCFARFSADPPPNWFFLRFSALIELGELDAAEQALEAFVRASQVNGDTTSLEGRTTWRERHAAKLVIDAIAFLWIKEAADQLRIEYVRVLESCGEAVAAQHLRNVIYACSFGQTPPLLAQYAQDLKTGRLHGLILLLEQRHFSEWLPLPTQKLATSGRRVLLLAGYLPGGSDT